MPIDPARLRRGPNESSVPCPAVHLFHYHLVTSRVREVEARYIGKLGFDLVSRHGRIGEDLTSYESGVSWTELDALGFKLRLAELEKGSVNVVVQPGQWPIPRVDHLGLALDDDEFEAILERAGRLDLRIQEHAGRRTFLSTNAGYRLEIHPPRRGGRVDRRDGIRALRGASSARGRALSRRLDRLDRDEADRRPPPRRAPQLRRRHGRALHQRRDHLRGRAADPPRLCRRRAH